MIRFPSCHEIRIAKVNDIECDAQSFWCTVRWVILWWVTAWRLNVPNLYAPVRIILPFKDQRSADVVRRQVSDLGKKINSDLRPVFTSKKIADDIKVAEAKPPLINQQCVVYKFECDLCDADYVGKTRRHLFQRIKEHKHSAIGKHLRDAHNQRNNDLREQFTILKKCRGKFECLIYEMVFIQEMKPELNTQSDSIKAKLFSA